MSLKRPAAGGECAWRILFYFLIRINPVLFLVGYRDIIPQTEIYLGLAVFT